MDKETREFLDQKFNAIDEKFAGIDEKFAGIDGQFEETKRHFGVIAEGLRVDIQQVAEGVANVNEKLDRNLSELRRENEEDHRNILAAIKFSYTELDQRIRVLETEVSTLKTRLDRIETRG